MKIILFSHFSTFHGRGWNRTFLLAKHIANRDFNVTLLTTANKFTFLPYRSIYINNVKIVIVADIFPNTIKKLGVSPLSTILRILYVLFKKFDITFADSGHRPVSGFPCRINRFIYRSKYITEWWDYFGKGGQFDNKPVIWKKTYGKIDNFLENNDKLEANGVVALSTSLMDRAISIGVKKEKVTVIRGGSDIENIVFFNDFRWRKDFDIDKSSFVMAFIGANRNELYDLLPFFYALNNLKYTYDVLFVTSGKKNILHNILIQNNLLFPFKEFGYLQYGLDYSKFLSCANLFILTLNDNIINRCRWPNKTGDYLAAGRPILTTKVGDLAEMIKNHPEYFIEVEHNANIIEQSLINIMKKKNEDRCFSNIRRIANNYSWEQKAEALINFYNNV
jgi:glycosyltransferase involved in cell wall biosynthesis